MIAGIRLFPSVTYYNTVLLGSRYIKERMAIDPVYVYRYASIVLRDDRGLVRVLTLTLRRRGARQAVVIRERLLSFEVNRLPNSRLCCSPRRGLKQFGDCIDQNSHCCNLDCDSAVGYS